MKRNYIAGAVLLLCSAFTSASQANVIYTANDPLGAAGLVTGTITTDGVLGALVQADFLSWNLMLNDGTTTANLTDLNSSLFFTGNVTATATDLQFDFNGNGKFLNFYGSQCSTEWSFQTTGSGAGCNGTTGNEEGVLASGSLQASAKQGLVTFATVATAVPEPVTISLFGIGLAGTIGVRRRKKTLA